MKGIARSTFVSKIASCADDTADGQTSSASRSGCKPTTPMCSMTPVVRLESETGQRELTIMRWGLIPFWAKDSKIAYSTINAKAETITTSPVFREAMKRRRCLVPADFFYEWKKLDAKKKQPYAIAMKDGSLFAFAGLWERWKDRSDGTELESFTIITTDPNELMQPLHDRMPVIVKPSDYSRWLDSGNAERPPVDLLRPFDADLMTAWRVGPDVGNVRNNRPDLFEPLST